MPAPIVAREQIPAKLGAGSLHDAIFCLKRVFRLTVHLGSDPASGAAVPKLIDALEAIEDSNHAVAVSDVYQAAISVYKIVTNALLERYNLWPNGPAGELFQRAAEEVKKKQFAAACMCYHEAAERILAYHKVA
jgi:cellobiose-specific phosphotransferase system component IIA